MNEYFKIDEEYEYGLIVADMLLNDEEFQGRLACSPHDYGVLAQAIGYAGRGLYVEFGALYGGSAILAAKVRNKFWSNAGPVVAVDIFQDYYGNRKDPKTPHVTISPQTLIHNAERHGVLKDLVIVTGKSYPLPPEIRSLNFPTSIVFIDADHEGNGPINDFYSARLLNPSYVVFHDYSPDYPDVVRACQTSGATYDYDIVHISGTMCVMKRSEK